MATACGISRFTLAPILLDRGIDSESLARAQARKKELRVSGEA